MSNLCPEAVVPRGRHDWRLIDSRECWEYDSQATDPMRGPIAVNVLDRWYCTQCRKVEETKRERRGRNPEVMATTERAEASS